MLLSEQRVRSLQRLKPFHVTRRRHFHCLRPRYAPPQHAVSGFLPPPRQHERMNLEGVCDRLDLHALQLTEFHCLELELQAVPMNLLWSGTGHGNTSCG